VRVVFEAEVVGGELTAEVGGTTDEARWFPLAQVPDLRRSPIVDVAVTAWLETRPVGR
jgi:8-oxo-dGTP diphosphatase